VTFVCAHDISVRTSPTVIAAVGLRRRADNTWPEYCSQLGSKGLQMIPVVTLRIYLRGGIVKLRRSSWDRIVDRR